MRLAQPALFVGTVLASFAHAISLQDAGVHDWHIPLLGQPAVESAFTSPRFHYPAGRQRTSVSSLVYTATERNVIGAIEPRAGEVVWRQTFPIDQPILRYALRDDYLLALTGPAASQIHLLSASTGHSQWSLTQHEPTHGLLPEPGSIAADAVFYDYTEGAASLFDIISLSNGRDIRRIHGKTGEVVWHYSFNNQEDPTTYLHAIVPPSAQATILQVVAVRRSTGAYSLLTLDIAMQGGQTVSTEPKPIRGATLASIESLTVLPPLPGSQAGRAMFLDSGGTLKSILLAAPGGQEPILFTHKSKSEKYHKLISVNLEERGLAVAKRPDGTAAVIQVGSDGVVSSLHEWSDSVEEPVFSGFVDRDGISHLSRYSISRILGMASMSTYSVEASEFSEAGTVFASTFNYSPTKHGRILHVTAEIAPRKASTLLSRLCVTTAGGSFQGWLGSALQWGRPEGLAHISTSRIGSTEVSPAIAFLELDSSRAVKPASSDSLLSFPTAMTFQSVTSPLFSLLRNVGLLAPSTEHTTSVSRDWLFTSFGYRKLVLAGTDFGKICAVDLGDGGKIVWEHYLVPVSDTAFGKGWRSVSWKRLAVFDARPDGRVLVMAIAEVANAANEVFTLAFYLDGLTGVFFDKRLPPHEVLANGATQSALVLHGSRNPTVLLIGKNSRVQLASPPSSILHAAHEAQSLPAITVVDTSEPQALRGLHAFLTEGANPVQAEVTWRLSLPATQRIVDVARQTNGKVASMGRVLGDRSTLYKYMNSHMMAVATMDDSAQSAHIYLIDSVTGTVMWSASHPGAVQGASAVKVTLTENWLVYTFTDTQSEGRQTRLNSVELFEPAQDKKHGTRSTFSSFGNSRPTAVSRSFVFPGYVTSLATSQTLHGVSTKALLVGTDQDQLVAIPRRFLDPRRPLHKPTKADMEEYLLAYDPVIPLEPKWIISHKYRVAGVAGILTSPTILESTSQVFAYGLDLFGSSVSPSGRFDVLSTEFNKLQLIATTLGLLGAILVMKPIVQRKQLKERWYPAT